MLIAIAIYIFETDLRTERPWLKTLMIDEPVRLLLHMRRLILSEFLFLSFFCLAFDLGNSN